MENDFNETPAMPEGMQDYSQPTQPADEPTVTMEASTYDQGAMMGMVFDTIEDFVSDEWPEAEGAEFDQRCHGVMSDLIANALSAVLYQQDGELLDAILKKAIEQAARRQAHDDKLDEQFEELLRALDSGDVGFVSHTPEVN